MHAPLMIVKGDGSLMKAEIAIEYPVETILSGPAASVVGAGFLTGLADFVVADMGGTTTDIAVVSGGRPVISDRRRFGRRRGAPWSRRSTCAPAVSAATARCASTGSFGFGSVRARRCRSALWHMSFPLCARNCVRSRNLHACPITPRNSPFAIPIAGRPSIYRRRSGACGRHWMRSRAAYRPLCAAAQAWRRCVGSPMLGSPPLQDSRRAMPCTCWMNSMIGAARRPSAAHAFSPPRNVTHAQQMRQIPRGESASAPLNTWCAKPAECCWPRQWPTTLASRRTPKAGVGSALDSSKTVVAGRRFSSLLEASMKLARPLVAIGAPAAAYYPEVARRLGAELVHPGACGGVQRGGRGRGSGVADR